MRQDIDSPPDRKGRRPSFRIISVLDYHLQMLFSLPAGDFTIKDYKMITAFTISEIVALVMKSEIWGVRCERS